MKTRYWKLPKSIIPDWKLKGGVLFVHHDGCGWSKCTSFTIGDLTNDGRGIRECDAEGNPLDAKPAPLTRADLEAFEARLRVNLEALRTP